MSGPITDRIPGVRTSSGNCPDVWPDNDDSGFIEMRPDPVRPCQEIPLTSLGDVSMKTLVSLRKARPVSRGPRSALRHRARAAVLGLLVVCTAAAFTTTLTSPDIHADPVVPAVKVVPTPATRAATVAAAPATSPAVAPAPPANSTITLHRGDTLWELARRYRTTVPELQSLNELGLSTLIRAGAPFRVPAVAFAAPRRVATPVPAKTHPAPVSHQRVTPGHDVSEKGASSAPDEEPDEAAIRRIAAAIFGSGYGCAAEIISRESGWHVHATNPHSGAYGLAQALPGAKMARSGPNWRTDAATQLTWMRDYVTSRYGGVCGAWAHWLAHSWY